jgi:hypothetical protein
MKPLSATLSNLIVLVEEIIGRPNSDRPFTRGDFATLAAEVRHADSSPAESVRATNAAMVTVIAIEAFRAGERNATSPWLMVIGATLPLLRGDAFSAFKSEREQRL